MRFNPKKRFQENLTFQIFVVFSVLVFTMSASFSMITGYYQKKTLLADLEENGRLLSNVLAHAGRIGVFSENPSLLRGPVDGVFQNESVEEVSLFNPEGIPIYQKAIRGKAEPFLSAAGPNPPGSKIFPAHHLDQIRVEDRADTMVFWSAVLSGRNFNVQTPLLDAVKEKRIRGNVLGFIRITLGKSDMKHQLYNGFLKNLFITVCFLMIGTLITYYLARRITLPLKQLTAAVITAGRERTFRKLPADRPDEIGNLAMAFNNMSDAINERDLENQQLEDKLWQSQKMEAIGTLAGGIAHDFNNILGIITGFSEIALITAPPDSKHKDYLQEVFNAAGRAKDLVRQILTFSRKSKAEGKPLQIGVVIKEALKMMRASLPSTIELETHIERDLPSVIADPTQIYQVIMNLCTNAAHAMKETDGRLDVRLGAVEVDAGESARHPDLHPGKYQKLAVRDSGHGMGDAVLARIFDPFYTTKGPGEGTGMGLAVVHGIVKGHDGAILVNSELGKGSCFEVYFPSLDSVAYSKPEAMGPLPTGREKILLVDDEQPLVVLGQQMLSSLGYQVSTETNGMAALEAFQADPHRFDLVITDLTMPKMTGVDLARRILQLRGDIPIILCTGFSEAIQLETAKSIGIRELAIKPIIWQDLAQTIRKVLT